MGSLWVFSKKFVFISALLLASAFWQAEVLAASLYLSWTSTSNNEDGFKIERLVGGLVNATLNVPAAVTSYADSALVAGTVYCYRVEAFNSAGDSDPSNQSCATAQDPIVSASTSSSGSASSSGGITPTTTTTSTSRGTAILRLAWTDTSDSEDGFKIERLVGGLVDATLTLPANATSYIDSALVAGTVYCYRVEAFNSAGGSDASNQACATAQNPVVASTSLTPTLTASPTKVMAGATVTAMWTGITAPTPKDWIGLYGQGTVDTKFINWMYVSCSANAGTARASGSCIYLLPATLPAGDYQLRLFANDGFTRLTAGNTFSVSTSPNSTPIVLANSNTAGKGSSTGLLPQVSREWSDYDLKVNLRSMSTNSIGVMFRYQDDRNYYRFIWNQKSKFRRLEKIENGTPTVLANDAVGYVKGRTYQLQMIVQGPTLRAFIDGAQIFSVGDSTFAEGTIGLYSSSNQVSFDNVVVQDLNTGAVLLSQDFDDGTFTGWTIVDQSKSQGPSTWSAAAGSLLQTSNIDGTFAFYMARSWTDYRFTAKLQSLDKGSMGVMFRYQDSNDYYRFSWDNRVPLRRLEKSQNGTITLLAKDTVPYVTGENYNLEITAKGTSLTVSVNGKVVFSVTDSSLPKGTVALYSSHNQGSSFDNVLVEDLTTGVVLLSDDFNDGVFTGWTIVDQDMDQRPSAWSVKNGSFVQSNNIGSNTGNGLGTYALY